MEKRKISSRAGLSKVLFYLNGLYDSNDERPISGRSKFPSYSNG